MDDSLTSLESLLGELDIGKWLKERLAAENAPPLRPHVLVCATSLPEIARVFPEGLRWHSAWQYYEAIEDIPSAAVADADVIIWGMAALRMFPAEGAAILKLAEAHQIPIWVIVVGYDYVGEPEQFYSQAVPRMKNRLPPASEIIVEGVEDTRQRVLVLLTQRSETLVNEGRRRRQQRLYQETLEKINTATARSAERVAALEVAFDQVQIGIAATQGRVGATLTEGMTPYRALLQSIDTFLHQEVESIEEAVAYLSLKEIQQRMMADLQRWYNTQFTGQIDNAFRQSLLACQHRCKDLVNDLQSSFSICLVTASSPELADIAKTVSLDEAQKVIQDTHDALNQAINEKLRQRIEAILFDFSRIDSIRNNPARRPPSTGTVVIPDDDRSKLSPPLLPSPNEDKENSVKAAEPALPAASQAFIWLGQSLKNRQMAREKMAMIELFASHLAAIYNMIYETTRQYRASLLSEVQRLVKEQSEAFLMAFRANIISAERTLERLKQAQTPLE